MRATTSRMRFGVAVLAGALSLLFGLAGSCAMARAPVPLVQIVRRADLVVVGTSAERAVVGESRIAIGANGGSETETECVLQVEVLQVLRGDLKAVGGKITLRYPGGDCVGGPIEQAASGGAPVLWFLQGKSEEWRLVAPDDRSWFRLDGYRTEVRERAARTLQQEGLEPAIGQLLLEPGVAFEVTAYADGAASVVSDVAVLMGSERFLRFMAKAYQESDRVLREQFSLVFSRFDMCLGEARQAQESRMKGGTGWPIGRVESEQELLRRDAIESSSMDWKRSEEVIEIFGTRESAVNDLRISACSSLPRVRSAVRRVLVELLGVSVDSLVCPACEGARQ